MTEPPQHADAPGDAASIEEAHAEATPIEDAGSDAASFAGTWTDPGPARPRRRLLYAALAVAALGGLGAAVAIALTSDQKTGFPTGAGSATISWRSSVSDMSNNFSGTVAGVPVHGTATAVIPSPGSPESPPVGASQVPVARWTGTFERKHFDLAVSEGALLSNAPTAGIKIDGTYGSQPVHFTASVGFVSGAGAIDFRGTVGRYHVSGTVHPSGGPASNAAQATFVVTG